MSFVKLVSRFVFTLAAAIVVMVAPGWAEPATEWTIDAAHSTIGFSARHFYTQVPGTFDKFSGTLRFDPANLAGSRVEIEIPVESINTRIAARDRHLRSADFFHADSFPVIRFVGETFVHSGGRRYHVVGHLTLRGTTRRVALPFDYLGEMPHPMKAGHVVTGTRIRIQVLRSDFGIGTGNFAGTAVIGDDVEVLIDIEATRPNSAGL